MRDNYLELNLKELKQEIDWQKRVIALSTRSLESCPYLLSQTEKLKKELDLLEARLLELKTSKKK